MYKSKIENLHAVSSSTLRCLGRLTIIGLN